MSARLQAATPSLTRVDAVWGLCMHVCCLVSRVVCACVWRVKSVPRLYPPGSCSAAVAGVPLYHHVPCSPLCHSSSSAGNVHACAARMFTGCVCVCVRVCACVVTSVCVFRGILRWRQAQQPYPRSAAAPAQHSIALSVTASLVSASLPNCCSAASCHIKPLAPTWTLTPP